MPVLSDNEIAALLKSLNVPAGVAAILVAITHPESTSNSTIVQQGQPAQTTGWGLWQITPTSGISQNGQFGNLLNALNNAKAAIHIYNAQGFSAWTTYNTGAYKPYLADASNAVAKVYAMPASQVNSLVSQAESGAPQSQQSSGSQGGLLSWPSDIINFFSTADTTVNGLLWLTKPSNWLRIGALLAGVALILVAAHAFLAIGEGQPLAPKPTIMPVPV